MAWDADGAWEADLEISSPSPHLPLSPPSPPFPVSDTLDDVYLRLRNLQHRNPVLLEPQDCEEVFDR